VMMSTYLTLLRLFQGTVRVEHLKGPVGITHMGTIIADRGPIWLMFFFALVSVNLAVINFLPLPIVDGGQFLMIVYEWVRGKPVPVGLQNAMTLAGLLLIGSVFVIVTFNDVARLLGG
ncbi:MAG: site-2 protease family protein, partial [Phycisphaerales bacterium]|nr:site-2 protease family protein [Phycisphaerales bacterium]